MNTMKHKDTKKLKKWTWNDYFSATVEELDEYWAMRNEQARRRWLDMAHPMPKKGAQ